MRTRNQRDILGATSRVALNSIFNETLVTALKWRVDRTLMTIEVLCPIGFNIDNPNILRMGLTNDMNQSYINISDGSATHGPMSFLH
jgi:hypothetical protein